MKPEVGYNPWVYPEDELYTGFIIIWLSEDLFVVLSSSTPNLLNSFIGLIEDRTLVYFKIDG